MIRLKRITKYERIALPWILDGVRITKRIEGRYYAHAWRNDTFRQTLGINGQYGKEYIFVKKYAALILKNAERLHALIQKLIDFRRIEMGHKLCVIEKLALSELAQSIADSFCDLAETQHINFFCFQRK